MSSMDELYLTVASWDDSDYLVVELTTGEGDEIEDWGVVTLDPESLRAKIDLYPRADNQDWHFDLEDVQQALEKAHQVMREVAESVAAEKRALAQHD